MACLKTPASKSVAKKRKNSNTSPGKKGLPNDPWTRSSREKFRKIQASVGSKALGDGFRKANGSGPTAGAYETHFSNAGKLESLGNLLAQAKRPMSSPGRLIAKLRAYGNGDLDFRCTDHQHVDAGVGQSFKESGGDRNGNACQPHRNLDNVRASPKLPAGSIRKVFLGAFSARKASSVGTVKVKFAFPLRTP